jgi:hypothetical protein
MGHLGLVPPPLYYIYESSLAIEWQVESLVYYNPTRIPYSLLPAWEAVRILHLYYTQLCTTVAIV